MVASRNFRSMARESEALKFEAMKFIDKLRRYILRVDALSAENPFCRPTNFPTLSD